MKKEELLDRADKFGQGRDKRLDSLYRRYNKLLDKDDIPEETRKKLLVGMADLLEDDARATRIGRAGAWIAMAIVGAALLIGSIQLLTGRSGEDQTTTGGDEVKLSTILRSSMDLEMRPVDGKVQVSLSGERAHNLTGGQLLSLDDEAIGILKGDIPVGKISNLGQNSSLGVTREDDSTWLAHPAAMAESQGEPVALGLLTVASEPSATNTVDLGMCREKNRTEMVCDHPDNPWYVLPAGLAFRFTRAIKDSKAGWRWHVEFAEATDDSLRGKTLQSDLDGKIRQATTVIPDFVVGSPDASEVSEPRRVTASGWSKDYIVTMNASGPAWVHPRCCREDSTPSCDQTVDPTWADCCRVEGECGLYMASQVGVFVAGLSIGSQGPPTS